MGVSGNEQSDKMNATANDLKNQGNSYYTSRKFHEAIACYTKAIIHNPNVATYYTNRALCYLKLKQWDSACQDCQRALETTPDLTKGHFFLGQALLEMQLYDEAIASLMRAYELAKDQRQNFGDDITGVLRLAKKRRWTTLEEKRIQQEIELQTELNVLLMADKNRQIDAKKRLSDETSVEREQLERDYNTKIEQLNDMFTQVDDRRQKRDVPEVLCCRIRFGIMKDPVITPSGITYERRDIEEHLQRLGHFDPVTRKDLTSDQLIPNLALKEVINNFLLDNPWAEDY